MRTRTIAYGCFSVLAFAGLFPLGRTALAGKDVLHLRISQKDQAFKPNSVTIPQGSVLDIVNDDGDLLHHAYVDSDRLKYDSGDQEPGQTASISFDSAGTFQVLCGIHPRMRLRVTVSPR